MWWSRRSLLEVEADLRRAEIERAARALRRPGPPSVRREWDGRPWRAALGPRLMRVGARLAGLDAGEHAPALRRPRPEPTA